MKGYGKGNKKGLKEKKVIRYENVICNSHENVLYSLNDERKESRKWEEEKVSFSFVFSM